MSSLISVIVPVYNVEDYIERCVDSIIDQTYKNLEIILIDDGSKDNSGNICDNLMKKDERISVIHKENAGLSSARNTGIEIAKGEYIGFVDSDDYIDRRMYEKLYEKIQEYKADISICGRFYTYENGAKFVRYKLNKGDKVMDSQKAILEMNSFRTFDMAVWDKLFYRKLFENIRFPEGRLSEDYFIMYKLFDVAKRICYTPEALYYYSQRDGSISRNKKINFDFIKAAKEQMDFGEKKYPELKNCLHTAYASANMTVYNFHIKNDVKCEKADEKRFQHEVRKNIRYIQKNNDINVVKKIQAGIFILSIPLYRIFFKIFKIVDKV